MQYLAIACGELAFFETLPESLPRRAVRNAGAQHPRYEAPESLGIQPFSSNDRLVYGAAIDIGALRVIFTFGGPDYATHYRPSGVRFRRQDDTAEKVVGFNWPEAGHPFIEYLRAPPSDS